MKYIAKDGEFYTNTSLRRTAKTVQGGITKEVAELKTGRTLVLVTKQTRLISILSYLNKTCQKFCTDLEKPRPIVVFQAFRPPNVNQNPSTLTLAPSTTVLFKTHVDVLQLL